MMLRSTTFPAGRIPSFENFTTHDVWEEILSEISMGIIRAGHYQLLREALRRYPTNRVFAELYETYVSGQAADRVTGTQIASLLHGLRVQGPDGRQFLVDDAPAEQTVGDLAANIADHYFEGSVFERESLVADAVGSDGEGHRLDPTLTLALAGISDGDLVRVNWQPGRQLRTVSPRGRASTAQEVVKVILVGEGAAGKTSLITAIGNKPFEESTRTHGIDIQSLAVDDLESGIQVTLRFWDFGGQPVYRITHPLFFSAHALYLVVWSARVGSEKDDVRGWLTRITQRVGDAAAIMIVATHRDEAPDTELDYAALEQEFPGLLQGDYRVDNKSRTGIPELRDVCALGPGGQRDLCAGGGSAAGLL
jgi:hypothetical protein